MHHRGSYVVLFHTRLQIMKYKLLITISFFLYLYTLSQLNSCFDYLYLQKCLSSNNGDHDLLVEIIINYENIYIC